MPQDNLITNLDRKKTPRPKTPAVDQPDLERAPPPPPLPPDDPGDYAPPPDALTTWFPSPRFFNPEKFNLDLMDIANGPSIEPTSPI